MIYISLDIETTGLDPNTNDVLEVGAYIEDSKKQLPREQLPSFHYYIWKENYIGNAYAISMNQRIFQKILELKKNNDPMLINSGMDLADRFEKFLIANKSLWPEDKFPKLPLPLFHPSENLYGPFVLAGKNIAGFDLPFLKGFVGWKKFKFHHRVLDPAALYFDNKVDVVPPDLSTCKKRAGLSELVQHEALDDAWDVISLVRNKFPQINEH